LSTILRKLEQELNYIRCAAEETTLILMPYDGDQSLKVDVIKVLSKE